MAGRRKMDDLTEIELMLTVICCDLGEVPASYIHREINKKAKRSYTAVKTELNRIVAKGFLSQRKLGPIWLYSPVKPKAEILNRAVNRFVTNILDGSVAPLVSHFACSNKKISPEELNEIKRLIDQVEDSR